MGSADPSADPGADTARAWDRAAAAGSLAVAAAVELPAVWTHESWATHPLLRAAGIAVAAAGLLWRRTRFVPAAVVVLVATTFSFQYTAVYFLAYAAGRYQPVARSLWFALAAGCEVVVLTATGTGPPLVRDDHATSIATVLFLLAMTVVAGTTRRQLAQDRAQLETAARQREADAVNAERARLAREFHDLLGHDVALLNVLVETLRVTLLPSAGTTSPPPADTRSLLDAAQRQCASAGDHLRSMTTVLRLRELDAPAAPFPDAAAAVVALSESLESVRASGVAVALDPDFLDVFGALPPDHRRIARRVVTEALTNALRHAPGADLDLRLHEDVRGWTLDVVNTPAHHPARPAPAVGTGLGLAGLRSRLAALNGTVAAGPLPQGGYRVRAHAPWPDGAPIRPTAAQAQEGPP